jgi:transcriptional regulator with XRE-family HTH domain
MQTKFPVYRVREIRDGRGLTQKELGARMNPAVTDSTVAKLESGRMALTVAHLVTIAAALGVAEIDLLEMGDGLVARRVPKISLDEAREWEAHAPSAQDFEIIPARLHGTNLFAVDAAGEVALPFSSQAGVLVVDPDARELIADKLYLVADGQAALRVRQLVTEPSLMLAPVAPGGPPLKIGETPFKTIGRIIHASFDL